MAGQKKDSMTPDKFLFKVEQTFFIPDRGLVLTPGLGDTIVDVDSKVRLVRPDKTSIDTRITSIVFQGNHDILVDANIKKIDVPIGTEVWLLK